MVFWATVLLCKAGDNQAGVTMKFWYGTCSRCRIDHSTYWPAVQHTTTIVLRLPRTNLTSFFVSASYDSENKSAKMFSRPNFVFIYVFQKRKIAKGFSWILKDLRMIENKMNFYNYNEMNGVLGHNSALQDYTKRISRCTYWNETYKKF